jgi:hypothetical protein
MRISDRGQNLTLLRHCAFVVISTWNPVARNVCYRGSKNIVLTNIVEGQLLMQKLTVAKILINPSKEGSVPALGEIHKQE